jgi:lysozyme
VRRRILDALYTATALALALVVCTSCRRESPRPDTASAGPAAGVTTPPAAGATAPNAAGVAGAAPSGAAARPYRMSPQGLERIRQREAYVAKVYDDGIGNQTVGYGHMLRSGESFPGGLTVAQAQELFAKDVERIVSPVLDRIKVPLTQNQVDAIGSFVFNVGPGNFTRSILPNLNLGNHQGVIASMFKYITGRNQRTGERVTLRGLRKRRQEEIALYKQGSGLSLLVPGGEWSRAARRLLANGMQFLRAEPLCVFDACRRSRSPS